MGDTVAVVDQQFSGPIEAKAALVFAEQHALEIVRDMMGSEMSVNDLAEFEQEAMCELGNIILNACLSAMADMLNIAFRSSLPNYLVTSSDQVLGNMLEGGDQAYILILHIHILIEKRQTQGQLIFLLSSESLSTLLRQVQSYLETIS
jgi:chemotaxis protein CheC